MTFQAFLMIFTDFTSLFPSFQAFPMKKIVSIGHIVCVYSALKHFHVFPGLNSVFLGIFIFDSNFLEFFQSFLSKIRHLGRFGTFWGAHDDLGAHPGRISVPWGAQVDPGEPGLIVGRSWGALGPSGRSWALLGY